MYGNKEIIREAAALPVEERAVIVDSLLRTLNQSETQVDAAWGKVAKRRLSELRSERVQPVPGDHVFDKIKERLAK